MYEIIVEVPGASGPSFLLDKDRPKEFQIAYRSTRHAFSQDSISTAILVMTFLGGIPVGVLANGLYDLIKKHAQKTPEKITIDRVEIVFDKGEIQKVIAEHVEHKKK